MFPDVAGIPLEAAVTPLVLVLALPRLNFPERFIAADFTPHTVSCSLLKKVASGPLADRLLLERACLRARVG